jgi:hypothetical protein
MKTLLQIAAVIATIQYLAHAVLFPRSRPMVAKRLNWSSE